MEEKRIDLSKYKEPKPHYWKRGIWYIVNRTLFRCFPGIPLRYVRNVLLKMFGAKIPLETLVYPSCRIWAPWNLKMGKHSCIGPHTEIYNKAPIIIKDHVTISQGAHLYTASHDISQKYHPLITAPIIIENYAWIAADTFIGMGVTIHEGGVVGARGCVFKDVEAWTVVGGNPAKFIKRRNIE